MLCFMLFLVRDSFKISERVSFTFVTIIMKCASFYIFFVLSFCDFISELCFIPPGLVNSGLSDRLSELDFFICDFQISAGFDEVSSVFGALDFWFIDFDEFRLRSKFFFQSGTTFSSGIFSSVGGTLPLAICLCFFFSEFIFNPLSPIFLFTALFHEKKCLTRHMECTRWALITSCRFDLDTG